MRAKSLPAAILCVCSLAGLAAYLGWAAPEINSPLGLDRFEESRVRDGVRRIAESVLASSGRVRLSLKQELDGSALKRMQKLMGVSAANHWANREVPVLKWSYAVLPEGKESLGLSEASESPLTIGVSSTGVIQSLTRKIPPKASKLTKSFDEAKGEAVSLLRLLGYDPARLVLTGTESPAEQGGSFYKFIWKESPEGLPGLTFEYTVTLDLGYVTSFQRDIRFHQEEEKGAAERLFLPLGMVAVWFFLVLTFLFLSVQSLRRDVIDWMHTRRVAVAVALGCLAWFLSDPSQGWGNALVRTAVASPLLAIFLALLWAVSESFMRQAAPARLRQSDMLLIGNWRVREVGRAALWGWGGGLALLAAVAAVLWMALRWRGLEISMLPPALRIENLAFPGGMLLSALLAPVPAALIWGLAFFGILHPLLGLWLPKPAAFLLVITLFALASTLGLGSILDPWPLALSLSLAAGAGLALAAERGGILACLLMIYAPLAVRNASALLSARQAGVHTQGVLALSILGICLAAAAAVSLFGLPEARVREYEPAYLRRMRERERFARELEVAKGIQQRFLPKTMPEIPGFEVAAACQPAMEVGGDMYDVLPLIGGRWLLLIGDVSGKGVKAAFYMTLTKGIIHAIAFWESDHREIIRRLNEIFKKLTDDGVFLTLCAVILEPEARAARLISAGHNPPLLLRGGEVETLEPRGVVLGVVEESVFLNSLRDVSLVLLEGDCLVLYTDGVSEAMDAREEEFGMERLRQTLRAVSGAGPKEILAAIVRAVEAHEAGSPQADDLTLLVLKANAPQ